MDNASVSSSTYASSAASSRSHNGRARGSRPANAPYSSQWYPRFQRPSSHLTPQQRQQRGFEPRSHTSVAPQRPSSHRGPSSGSVTPRPSITPSSSTAASSRPTTASQSSYSSDHSASARPTFTSFYSSSSSTVDSFVSSPATSVSSGPPLIPVVTDQMLQPQFEGHIPDTVDKEPPMSRRLSAKVKLPSPEIRRTHSDYPSVPAVPNFSVPRQSSSNQRKSSGLGKRTSAINPSPSGPARYYQDPDARRKLQQCLSSPQKFDEALDFGFAPTPQPMTPTSPRAQPDFSGNHVQQFLMDSKFLDDSSQFGYDSQDETESVETDNENGSERGYSAFGKDINYTGFDEQAYVRRRSNSRPSRSLRRKTLDGDMFGEREMTLRLTLTKPEARDDGTGWFMDHAQQENDAFELQQQQRMREHIAMQRAVSRDGKKQNLFSRFKGRR